MEKQVTKLRALVLQAKHNLDLLDLHDSRVSQSRELLDAAVALADDLLEPSPAAILGTKGGKAMAKRVAGMRKILAVEDRRKARVKSGPGGKSG